VRSAQDGRDVVDTGKLTSQPAQHHLAAHTTADLLASRPYWGYGYRGCHAVPFGLNRGSVRTFTFSLNCVTPLRMDHLARPGTPYGRISCDVGYLTPAQ
jgi:hypothetical protein